VLFEGASLFLGMLALVGFVGAYVQTELVAM